jgi:HD superfamily phosphodiesterase
MARRSKDFHGKKVYKVKRIIHETVTVEANNEEDALELVNKGKMVLSESYYTPRGRYSSKVKAKRLLETKKNIKPARILSSALSKREQSKRIERAKNRVMSQIPCDYCKKTRSEHMYEQWAQWWYCHDLVEYRPTHTYAEWQAKHGKEVLTHG